MTKEEITYDAIVFWVCSETGLPREKIYEDSRRKPISTARQIVWYCLRAAGWHPTTIAQRFGKDRSSVIQGCNKIKRIVEKRKRLEQKGLIQNDTTQP